MTLTRTLVGIVLLALVVGPIGLAAVTARRALLPRWDRAPARLAEIVLGLWLLCATSQLLGTIGLFHLGPLLTCSIALGSVAWLSTNTTSLPRLGFAARLRLPALTAAAPPPAPRPTSAIERAGAITAGALVASMWSTWVAQAREFGIGNGDSVWYHLPMAARFAQTGDVWSPFFANAEALVTYYPANASILHGVGFLAMGSDVLSIVLNAALLPIALLAGWCLGRPAGRQAQCAAASALVLALPIMAASQPGTAKDDLLSITMLLAAGAFLAHSTTTERAVDRPVLVMAGLAAGLALSAKLTMVVPVAALTLSVIALAPRGTRRPATAAWGAPLAAAGAYWYVRNLIVVGNPIPSLGLALPKPPVASIQQFGSTVAHHLADTRALTDVFGPGLGEALGPAWLPLVVVTVVGGLVSVVLGPRVQRMLGVTVLVTVAAYLVTPGGAYGLDAPSASRDAVVGIFAYNLRYLAPALALGLCAFAHAPGFESEGARRSVLAGLLALLLVTQVSGAGADSWSPEHGVTALLTMATIGGAGAWWARRLQLHPRILRTGGALAAFMVVLGGTAALRTYDEGRYSLLGFQRWASSVTGARIGVVGFVAQYPFVGEHLANQVQYVGERGPHGSFGAYGSCAAFRAGVHDGGLDFLVAPTGPVGGALGVDLARWRLGQPGGEPPLPPRELAWIDDDPGLSVVERHPEVTIYAVTPRVSSLACPAETADG